MNTNIAKLQAQLQGLSPQQIQMAVQGGSVPPWLAAVEQQRRMDLSKRMQSATPPRSTVVQDMQVPQGIQAYAGGGGVRRKRPEEEGIAASVPYAETDEAQLMPVLMGMPDDQFDSLLDNMQGMHPIDKGLVLQAKNRREMGKSGIAAVAPQKSVEPEGRMGISTSINEPSNVPPTATLPPDPTLITPNETPLTNDLQNWAYGSPEAAAAAQPNPELTAGLRKFASDESPSISQAGINQIGDLRDSENLMNDPEVYAKEAAQETNQPQGIQQAVAPQETIQPQGQPLPTIEQLAPVQQAVTPVPMNPPEVEEGIAKLAQTPQAPAGMSTPEQTYAATATPDSYSQGLAKLRKAMEIDNPMPEIRTKESEKNVKEREAQRQDVEDNNLGWSVMQAAAAMMAGDSPYASVNIGQGALAGLQKYAEGKKTIRDLGKDINALQADREAALNSRDYQKYTLKQNQLAVMTDLAERAQQAELQRQSVEGIHQLDRESAERMAKDRNAAMLKATGLRGAGSGGLNTEKYLGDTIKLFAARTAVKKEYGDRLAKIEDNKATYRTKDDYDNAIRALNEEFGPQFTEIDELTQLTRAQAGFAPRSQQPSPGIADTRIKDVTPEKEVAGGNGKPTRADLDALVDKRDTLMNTIAKGFDDHNEYKKAKAKLDEIEAEIKRIRPLVPKYEPK